MSKPSVNNITVGISEKCAICLSPVSREYKLEGTFNYEPQVTYDDHSCSYGGMHFEAASFKSPAERLVNWLAVFGGMLFGLACVILLVFRRETDEHILFKYSAGV